MVLVPWRCYRELSCFSRQMGDLFERFFGGDVGALGFWFEDGRQGIEVIEGRDGLLVVVEVGDFGPDDLRVRVEGRTLFIEGVQPGKGSRGGSGGVVGSGFMRKIDFLVDFDVDRAAASLKGGRLTVFLPRARSVSVPDVKIKIE